jgi:arylsulfatase A
MRSHKFLLLFLLLAVVFQPDRLHAAQPRRPNVILVMTDDMGWGDVRSHGNDRIDTPVLDRLAASGVRFERFFVSSVCAPTRASLLTGRHHLRTGVCWVTRGLETMRSEEATLAEVLKEAGYATGCFGKWHNGAHYPYHPNGQGFDEFFGFCGGHWTNYFDATLERNRQPAAARGYITDVLTDAALAFVDKHRDHPFFCYVPFNAPHGPFQVPDRYFTKYRQRGLDDRTACIYGMVENIDDNVARLLKKLEELKLADDTIVIFTTDNGPNSDRYNGGMKGRKGSVDEGGIRVPLFVRWPGRLKAGNTVTQIAAHYDLLPTLVELCGIDKPKTLPLDGVSLVPLLKGQAGDWPERLIFTHQSRGGQVQAAPASVRTQQWRLTNTGKGWQLYDMARDPEQKLDVARENPQVVAKLSAAYDAWFREVTKHGFPRLPIPVGREQAPLVELPAPECYLEGKLTFKGTSGWAHDWLTNWTSTGDRAWWEIDVARPGRYEVTLLYTCPKADVGSTIKVKAAGRTVEGVVRDAHDPSPLPSPDRVPRSEVYEKTWARLKVGALELPKGPTKLTVQALTKPGRQVGELKGVQIKWVE